MKLDEVKKLGEITVKSIICDDLANDAFRFGIEPGKVLKVVNIIPGGPLVVQMGEQQVAIGRELAKSVEIEVN